LPRKRPYADIGVAGVRDVDQQGVLIAVAESGTFRLRPKRSGGNEWRKEADRCRSVRQFASLRSKRRNQSSLRRWLMKTRHHADQQKP